MSIAKRELEEIDYQRKERSRRRRNGRAFKGLPFELDLVSLSEVMKRERRQDIVAVTAFNTAVEQWAKETTVLLKISLRSLVKKDITLSNSIKPKLYYDKQYNREVYRVGFAFNREGVYVHKGAGRGQAGRVGSQWRNLRGELKKTSLSSLGKMGTGNRQPKEWFNPIIDQQLPKLADIVAEYSASMCVDAARIYIN